MSLSSPSIRAQLYDLAEDVRVLDSHAAEMLESLGDATEVGASTDGWEHLDPIQVIEPARLAMVLRQTPIRDRKLGYLEVVRNVFVLLPIIITWLGLHFAVNGYRSAIEANPSLSEQPFILLWQQGFHGSGGFWSSFLTLGGIALADALVIGVVVLITAYIHMKINVDQTDREQNALQIESHLRHVLWQAGREISQRTTPEGQFDQLVSTARELLDEISAERERIGVLSNEREQIMGSFDNAVHQFSESTSRMMEGTKNVDTAIALLQSTVEDATKRDQVLNERLERFTQAGLDNNRLHQRTVDGLDELASRIGDASEILTRASLESHASSNSLSNSLGLHLAEITGLREDLRDERDTYVRAADASKESADRFSRALDTADKAATDLLNEAREVARLLAPITEIPDRVGRAESLLTDASSNVTNITSVLDGVANSISSLSRDNETLHADAREVITAAATINRNRGFRSLFARNRAGRN